MNSNTRKTRLNPSKLLVLLMFGSYPYVQVKPLDNGSRKLSVTIGKFAKIMRVRNAHIVEYCQWLEKMNFVDILSIDETTIELIMYIPPLFVEIEK